MANDLNSHEKEVDMEASPSTESTILTGRGLFVVFVAMQLSILLTALDQTILATALPRIVSLPVPTEFGRRRLLPILVYKYGCAICPTGST
ncbi:hypothetical protein FB451DRAFT_1293421 [Mycena latifolia]|nr:hypothetical protein FB451DRAFT_1293421 [Mycena latifolia]